MLKQLVILLLVTAFFTPADRYCKNIPPIITCLENITDKAFPSNNDEIGADTTTVFEDEVTKKIMQDIDARVSWIKEYLNHKYHEDRYDGGIPVYRYFDFDADLDSFASYDLYYDEHGKLLYADIAHYRSTMYFMYFQNDELLHVETGPINGNLAHVEAVIKEDVRYAFILEDLVRCLEHAYK